MNWRIIALLILAGFILHGCRNAEEPPVSETGNIIVVLPQPGDAISSPVEINGQARVFEATVNIRICSADGTVLVDTFTTATEAGPAFGDFHTQVAFEKPPDADEGFIEVYSIDAKTGEDRDLVRIPVRFED